MPHHQSILLSTSRNISPDRFIEHPSDLLARPAAKANDEAGADRTGVDREPIIRVWISPC
jgi:hypothetical protein